MDDLPDVTHLSSESYSEDLAEDKEALWGKAMLGPDLSLVAIRDGKLCGYLISYPSAKGHIGKLNAVSQPGKCESWYLHDMSISKNCRGCGLASLLYSTALKKAMALGLKSAGLVSVQGSAGFWMRFGFTQWDVLDEAAAAALATYGPDAIYMHINL